jgi:membrane fusion protein, copper/silver efflux system
VEQSGAYARTPVKTGRRGDALIEILSGLKAGDRVVTNGNLLIDGQAEMNRSFAAPAVPPSLASALTDAQTKALGTFLRVADTMADALANENLAAFRSASKGAPEAARSVVAALRTREGSSVNLDALSKSAQFSEATDLVQARAAFHKFTMASIPVLEPLRTAPGAPGFQVWECYMVDRVIDGAPKFARWVQTGGRPGHNPFFGKDMLECAKEIKP